MKYYKRARLDGWDFYTGKTINYRDNIGKTVSVPNRKGKPTLCSDNVIHASWNPQCFIGASTPCSVFKVEGKPVVKDTEKAGFRRLKILEEIPQEELDAFFGWRYSEVINPVHPFKIQVPLIKNMQIELLKNWASVWASVWDSVGDSVRDSVGDSVWASVGASVRDSVGDSVGASVRDSVGASVRDSVGASVWASVWAYIGSLFPNIKTWKYAPITIQGYPYQSCVDLWKQGLVPSFDGSKWRLHGGEVAKILFEIDKSELEKVKK